MWSCQQQQHREKATFNWTRWKRSQRTQQEHDARRRMPSSLNWPSCCHCRQPSPTSSTRLPSSDSPPVTSRWELSFLKVRCDTRALSQSLLIFTDVGIGNSFSDIVNFKSFKWSLQSKRSQVSINKQNFVKTFSLITVDDFGRSSQLNMYVLR